MIRSAIGKVMWVGRATVFLVGLAVILVLLFGVASMALAKDGDPWLLGRSNVATAITSLGGQLGVNGPMVRITNNNADANDTALALNVQDGEAPMRVNSDKMVRNLNADKIDGMHASDLPPRGYAQVTTSSPFIALGSSKGVISVERNTQNVYCFQLSFEPKAAVASPNINNNATVGTVVGSAVRSKCGVGFEAAAVTYAANTDPSPARSDINFGIVFM